MNDAVIVENTETSKQILLTPIEDGNTYVNRVTLSGYNQSANAIEKTIVYTAQGNYNPDVIEDNPSLAEQAELTVTFESETGETLFSGTLDSQNPNLKNSLNNSLQNDVKSRIDPIGCFTDCFKNGLDNLSWYTEYLCMIVGPWCIYSIAQGCWSGCWSAWLWYDVL